MKYFRTFIFLCILYCPVASTYAQNDTVPLSIKSKEITIKPNRYSARKATLMSAALPGLGQAYTRAYWKIPIIYVGAGIIGYLIVDYSQRYTLWRDRYIIQRTATESGFALPITNADGVPYSLQVLDNAKDGYRRYRDLNVILASLLYVLNIADANVTAHLKSFDLSKDLSMSIQPGFVPTPDRQLGAGVSLRLTLK